MKTLLLSLIAFSSMISAASECYHYHTPHYFDLFIKQNQLVFQHTVKDPNKISYVSRDEIILKEINSRGFKIIKEDHKLILFSTNEGYFIVEKDWFETKEYGVTKIYALNQVSKTTGTSFFYVDNKWIYIALEKYSSKFNKKSLPKLSSNLTIVDKDDDNRRWLLKDDDNLYAFTDIENFKTIPNIDVKNFKLYKTESDIEEDFLYDDDTFYRVNYNYEYEDMKSNFDILKKQIDFLEFKFFDLDDIYIKATDNQVWAYIKAGMSLKSGETVYFYPIEKATFLNESNSLIRVNDKIYFDSLDAIYNRTSLDVSLVENLSNLERINFYSYTDGTQNYKFDYDKFKLFPIKNKLNINAKYYSEIHSYQSHTASFYNDNGILKYLDENGRIHIKRKIKSKVKFLKLVYAYDNLLLIEGQEVINSADFNTIEFLGSTVDVIQPCDGGKGQIPVKIKYYYFFKDKDKLYAYYSGDYKMKILEDVSPKDFSPNNYKQLKTLESKIR